MAQSNARTVWLLVVLVAFMVTLAFVSVPLYRLFCAKTGFGGTPRRADTQIVSDVVSKRTITVRLNADVNGDLAWDFAPDIRQITVHPGEVRSASYRATNKSNKPIVGMSSYNVQPEKAASYFIKIACFCFEEQLLNPGESKEFPLSFVIDSKIADDPEMDDVKDITLSYTFFKAKNQGQGKDKK